MTNKEKLEILQKQLDAERTAKKELLDALLLATGLDEYIAQAISNHEEQCHGHDNA